MKLKDIAKLLPPDVRSDWLYPYTKVEKIYPNLEALMRMWWWAKLPNDWEVKKHGGVEVSPYKLRKLCAKEPIAYAPKTPICPERTEIVKKALIKYPENKTLLSLANIAQHFDFAAQLDDTVVGVKAWKSNNDDLMVFEDTKVIYENEGKYPSKWVKGNQLLGVFEGKFKNALRAT